MKLFLKNANYSIFLVLLVFQICMPKAFSTTASIPKDLLLEELKLKKTGDVITDSRVVADPKTGRSWEFRVTETNDIEIVRTSQFKPWKPKKKLHTISEILKTEPVKP